MIPSFTLSPKVTGETSTRWNPGLLRRGQAIRRGAHDVVPEKAQCQHRDHADLQHVRPTDASQRRSCDPNFCQSGLGGAPITVHGDGSQTRSVCHVDDLVEGALRLLFSDLTGPDNWGTP